MDLRGRIVTEARTAPEDREGLCKEKEAWLRRWCALWARFLPVWRETELTAMALGQVELSALCKDSEDVGRPISPFDDFEGDELDCVRAGLVLQKSWAAAPVDVCTADEEVPIATLPVSRSSSPVGVASSGDGEKAAGCEAGDDDSGKDVDALEPMKTRSSGQKRARAEGVSVPPSKVAVVHDLPCSRCVRMGKACEGWSGEKCFLCQARHRGCSVKPLPPPSARPAKRAKASSRRILSTPPASKQLPGTSASASKPPLRPSASKGKGVDKPTSTGVDLSLRWERQLASSEEALKKAASSLFNQAEELRLLREAEFGSS
ncbi:hypothetical protein M405DRAFT_867777 [Rhizopogon salebrosus TDB-379]|nr:hypothetical protein M405DRAFT_867777 [Rhizopogon salebrosus TDB-379]